MVHFRLVFNWQRCIRLDSGADRGRQRLRGVATGPPSSGGHRRGERRGGCGGGTWRSALSPLGGPSWWPACLRKGAQETARARGETALPTSGQGCCDLSWVRGRAEGPQAPEVCLCRWSKVRVPIIIIIKSTFWFISQASCFENLFIASCFENLFIVVKSNINFFTFSKILYY